MGRPGAARHEAGSPNVIGAIALAAACATLARAPRGRRGARGTRWPTRLRAGPGRDRRACDTYSLFGDDHDRVGVAAFTVDGLDSSLVSAALSAEHGIGVRDGKFCAHLLVDALLDDPCHRRHRGPGQRRPGQHRRARRPAAARPSPRWPRTGRPSTTSSPPTGWVAHRGPARPVAAAPLVTGGGDDAVSASISRHPCGTLTVC